MINLYVDRIDRGSREDRSDHLWTQILRFYFEMSDNYGIEREGYRDESSLARTSVVLTNIRGGQFHFTLLRGLRLEVIDRRAFPS
jgi:hypothetical protein